MTEHHRVSPQGKKLGGLTARMTERGRAQLQTKGLIGVNLPGLRDEMCASCACRPGTVPNGCLQTQLDLLKAVAEGQPFLCHSPRDGRMCAGYAGARADHVARPLPAWLVESLATWEYSPPDEPEKHEAPHG